MRPHEQGTAHPRAQRESHKSITELTLTALASDDDDDARPSLIADWQHDPAPQGGNLRMLSGLESAQAKGFGRMPGRAKRSTLAATSSRRAAPPASARWWLRGMLLLCCALIGGVYVWFVVNQAELTPAPLPTLMAQATAVPPKAVASAAARIESMAPAGRAADTNPFQQLEAPVSAASASLSASAAPSAKAPSAPFSTLDVPDQQTAGQWTASRQAAEAASKAQAAAQMKEAVGSVASTGKGGAPATEVPEPVVPAAKQSVAQKRKAAREADAALLKALVAHVSTHSRGEVNGTMPPVRVAGGKAPPMTTIAQIVGYCRSLTGEEAKQCRVRICENYWGKDDACSTRASFHRADVH